MPYSSRLPIIDYQKFLPTENALKSKKPTDKGCCQGDMFRPQTDDHDYNFKLKHAKGFPEEGAKVKAYVFSKADDPFQRAGEVLLLRFANDLEDYGKVEQMPVLKVNA